MLDTVKNCDVSARAFQVKIKKTIILNRNGDKTPSSATGFTS